MKEDGLWEEDSLMVGEKACVINIMFGQREGPRNVNQNGERIRGQAKVDGFRKESSSVGGIARKSSTLKKEKFRQISAI